MRHIAVLTSLLLACAASTGARAQTTQAGETVIRVAGRETGRLPHFWRGIGFTPADLLLDERMRVQLAHVDGVPARGFAWARVHDLLELVRVEGLATDDGPTYDWRRLDHALDVMLDADLRPLFEVMGSPEGFEFTNMRDREQAEAWRVFVRDLARHLIDRYGADEVRSWRFEVWNEPDIYPWFEHPWEPNDPLGLIRYYDATSAGLADADPDLVFGGPGTALNLSPMLTGLLAHLDTGTNHLTGKSPPRCDFISVHVKGKPPTPPPANPDIDMIFDGQKQVIDHIREHHPRLAGLPFYNTECDPNTGWRDPHKWYAEPYYASSVAAITHRQNDETRGELGIDAFMMSNDHGFLGGWPTRSVMAAMPWTHREPDPNTSMVKKPVLAVATLLSLLGDRTLAVDRWDRSASPSGERVLTYEPNGSGEGLHAFATRTPAGDIAVLLTHHDDDQFATGAERVTLRTAGLRDDLNTVVIRRIDEDHTNPVKLWRAAGEPEKPGQDLLRRLREAAEPVAEIAPWTEQGIELEMPVHSVALVTITADNGRAPPPPRDVRARTTPGLHGEEVLVRWDDAGDPRRLKGYLVEAITPDGSIRLHEAMPIATAMVRPVPAEAERVRVTAVDLQGRSSDAVAVRIQR